MGKRSKYFMTFYEDIAVFNNLYNQDTKYFSHLLANANRDMVVHLSAHLKVEIVKKCGSKAKNKLAAADQFLNRFKKLGLIRPIGYGAYMISPMGCGFNSTVDRINTLKAKYIELKITYSDKGRKISCRSEQVVDETTGEIIIEAEEVEVE